MRQTASMTAKRFQSTLSSRRATCPTGQHRLPSSYFNPRSPHGERRHRHPHYFRMVLYFNPRSPHGERPMGDDDLLVVSQFQSTLSSRRATTVSSAAGSETGISIHALLTESDPSRYNVRTIQWIFQSTLSSRRATKPARLLLALFPFQSTLSSRRATRGWLNLPPDPEIFQSTLSSRRATEGAINAEIEQFISIHALLTESDNAAINTSDLNFKFQSTLSSRRATEFLGKEVSDRGISIHALLTESDRSRKVANSGLSNFNPRSPHGERQQIPPNWPYRFCLKCQF